MLTIILTAAVALVIILLFTIAAKPDTFAVKRSTRIAAPPERVFAAIGDFKAWLAWSPWEELDPNSKRTFGATTSGVGATYAWDGNNKVGSGKMTITESQPGQHLGIDLEFFRPFAARNRATFDLVADAGGTTITWVMSGRSSFMFKAMGLFMDCDKMVGAQFEQGLAKMRTICEAKAGA